MGLEVGAAQVIRQCLNLQPGERLLVVADTTRDTVGVALFEAATEAGADPVLALLNPRPRPHAEPPPHLARMMEEADAILLATEKSMTHTKARRDANRAGARVLSMPGVTEDMLSDGALTADHLQMHQVMRKLERRVRQAKVMRVASGGGTDLVLEVRGRAWITEDTGSCRRRGQVATLPAGELFVVPVEGKAEGRLVIDVTFQEPLGTPATVKLEHGIATRVVGATAAVAEMNQGGKEGRVLGKVGFGINPKARTGGAPVEAEKAEGVANFAFGDNVAFGGRNRCGVRVQALVREPTVEIDGKVLIERGKLAL
jgi:leucyl aminopeptidase (aminopeptidase T)